VSTKLQVIILSALLFLLAASAHAGFYGESISLADLTGSRTFSSSNCSSPSGELGGCWPYSFTIQWNISQDLSTSSWAYSYSLSTSKKSISHFILETSSSSDIMSSIFDIMINGKSAKIEGPDIWGSHQGNSNPGLTTDFYGIKFDSGGLNTTYSFTSTKDPVWGNFYAKSGKDKDNGWIYTYNNALGTSGFDSSNPIDFIPRPNGGSNPPVVPEPVSSVLFIAGGIIFLAKRFVLKKKQR